MLRARLADARFFWDQDQRHRLADRVSELQSVVVYAHEGSTAYQVPKLDGVVFHARLGSMAQKAERIAKLAHHLCPTMDLADAEMAERAGRLCKADLVTETVGEFPDLQGTYRQLFSGSRRRAAGGM